MNEVTWQEILDAERESNRLAEEYRLAREACAVIRVAYAKQEGHYENPIM